MVSKLKNSTHARFMQPLIHGFLNAFSIPLAFLRHLEEELEGRTLKSVVLMADPRRQWDVKIEGGRHFKDGWKEFCLYNHLGVGDFLVFVHQTHFLFHVEVFDPSTACQRHYTPDFPRPKRKPLAAQVVVGLAARGQTPYVGLGSQSPRCQMTLTPHCLKRKAIYLPMHFSKSSGLVNVKREMTLVDGEGMPWKVRLSYTRSNGQTYIMKGWRRFQAANNLKLGEKVCFQLLKAGDNPILKCYRVEKQNSSIHEG